MHKIYTDYLIPSGSYLIGAASAFSLDGCFFEYNISTTGDEADAQAIRQDFAMIAQDIHQGRESFDHEHKLSLCR